ncbi:hypothetical protein BVG19_g2431 [[Candida] boidinii]|nr:hypothetical protein BVG19_g2431 [[Candida] boidinii]OWB49089.1 hypothetical protein B5S27_g628 [[Candida] boidinii]
MITPNLETKNSSFSSLTDANSDALSAEQQEKIRLKKEKLAQWKLKKQAEAKTETETNSVNDKQQKGINKAKETKNETPEEEKIRLRREKLQAWKKKKQQKEEEELKRSASPSASPSPSISPLPVSASSSDKSSNGIKSSSSKNTPFGAFKKVSQSDKIKSKLGLFSKSIGLKRKSPLSFSKIESFSNEMNANDSGIQKRQKIMDFESTGDAVHDTLSNTSENLNDNAIETDDLDLFMTDIKKHATQLDAKSEINSDSTNTIVDDDQPSNDEENFDDDDDESKESKRLLKLLKEKNKKSIPYHEPSTEPFDKIFYHESDFIKNLTTDEVDHLRAKDNITVKSYKNSKNIKNPILEWSHLCLPTKLLSVIESLGHDSPTSIQCEALPNIMSGSDIIAIAKTGSGKTLAFLLPLFRQLMSQELTNKGEGPLALIMAPTRELTLQIFKECKPFLKELNLRGCCAYGGSPIGLQISELKKGVELLVCTPGRLMDLLCANSGRVTNLSRVTYLVLDEADRMFDMGFEPQVNKIVELLRKDKQTVLFSATFPPKIENLAKKILNKPIEILVGEVSIVSDTIKQNVEVLENEDDKFTKLLQILGNFTSIDKTGKVIIFVERQDSADKLLTKLLKRGYPCFSLHGGKDQSDRDSTINDFKNGIVDILIATSVAARGLDVKNLNLVVNFDCPNHLEDYVHRVGRTGRAGNSGEAYTFITKDQLRNSVDLVRALEQSEQIVPPQLLKMSQEFRHLVKEGKGKFNGSGFGGKGLEKLQEIREIKKMTDGDNFQTDDDDLKEKIKQSTNKDDSKRSTPTGDSLNEDESISNPTSNGSNGVFNNENKDKVFKEISKEFGFTADDFTLSSRKEKNINESVFSSTIHINDLPQSVRWDISKGDRTAQIIEMTSVSITTKGRFYPPGKQPASDSDDPKLYLLIESKNEEEVKEAVNLFKDLIIEKLTKDVESESKRGGRFTLG